MGKERRGKKTCQEVIRLQGSTFSLGIGGSSGRMEALDIKRSRLGRWNTIPGRLEIVDELQPGTYRDGRDPCRIQVRKAAGKVIIDKRFQKAKFTVAETWSVKKDEALWTVKVMLDRGEKPRSLRIRQFIPWPTAEPYGWNVWTAQQHFPKMVCHLGQTSMVYGDLCYGTVIPILSIYNYGGLPWDKKPIDVGMSIAKPFGLKIPRWQMSFDGFRGGGVTIESGYMKLAADRNAETALMLHPHEGDWRPGLGWLVKKYPSYFKPGNPKTPELLEGGFMGGSPDSTPEQAKAGKAHGAKVVEIHHHYVYYGHYFPEKGSWRTTERYEESEKPRSVEKIRRVIRMFNKHGILPLPYIQLAGDGYKPYVEKEFPESIALNIDGRPMGQTYYNVWMMNSDPSLPFGKHIGKEIDRFFKLYPEAGGLFWDQPCYDDYDSAHHDGVTMIDNKPMYRLVFCYEKHRKKMMREIKKRGMFVSANGPVYVELCEGLDQIMAEGHSWTADVVQYYCVARPMVFYSYPRNEEQVEAMFQKCLLAGGSSYSVPRGNLSKGVETLFNLYKPLLKCLVGRTWVFEPNPLEMPFGVQGNIFKGRDKNYYVTIVSGGQRLQDKGKLARALTFKVSIKAVRKLKSVTCQGPGTKWQRASFKVSDGIAEITLPKHEVASVVKLSVAR